MPEIENEEELVIISTEDTRGCELLKRGNFGDTLVPVLIGAVILSVTGMGIVAFSAMRGAA
jgi:hypothetical protein